MSKLYDIFVVGAGLGGLTAAFDAARSGKKELLPEQHNLSGGYTMSFVRGRFEFEPSLHEMAGMRSVKDVTGVVRYLNENAEFRAEAWADISEKEYFKTKNRIAEKLITQFEQATGITIKEHIEEIEIAKPGNICRIYRSL